MHAFLTQPVNDFDITALKNDAQYSLVSPLTIGPRHDGHGSSDLTSEDVLVAKELQWDAAFASNANDDLARIWRSMDDGNGRLSLSELDGWFKRKHPHRYFPAVIKHAFSISKNAKGFVDSNGFRRCLINIIRCLRAWVDWDTANESVDSKRVDSNGKATKDRRLDLSEFQRYFTKKYPTSSAAHCKREWEQLDVDRTGLALFGDFCSWFVKRAAAGFDLDTAVAPSLGTVAPTKPAKTAIDPSSHVPSLQVHVQDQAVTASEVVVHSSDPAAVAGSIGPSGDSTAKIDAAQLPESAVIELNGAISAIETLIEEKPSLHEQSAPLESSIIADDASIQAQHSSESFCGGSADVSSSSSSSSSVLLLVAQATVSLVRNVVWWFIRKRYLMPRLQIVQLAKVKYEQKSRDTQSRDGGQRPADASAATVTRAENTHSSAEPSATAVSVAAVVASIVNVVAARFATISSVVHVVMGGIVAGLAPHKPAAFLSFFDIIYYYILHFVSVQFYLVCHHALADASRKVVAKHEEYLHRLHRYRAGVHVVVTNVVTAIVCRAAHKASLLMLATAPPAEVAHAAPAAVDAASLSIAQSKPEAEWAALEETRVAANAVDACSAAAVIETTTTPSAHAAPEKVSFLHPTATPVLRTNAEAPEIGTLRNACGHAECHILQQVMHALQDSTCCVLDQAGEALRRTRVTYGARPW
jgi:hypothetical protein